MSRTLEDLRQDLAHGARMLRRSPGFTALAVLTMAVGIGANSAIFSVLDAALLRPLPFHDPDRLMKVALRMPRDGAMMDMTWSYPKFRAFASEQTAFGDVALYIHQSVTVGSSDGGERVPGEAVSARYLHALRMSPAYGAGFTWEDEGSPPPQAVVLGNEYWRRRFAGDPRVIGTTIDVNGRPFIVAGVATPGFRGLTGRADLWMPIPSVRAGSITQAGAHQYAMVARVRPGVGLAQAREITRAQGVRLAEAFPGTGDPWGATAYGLSEIRLDTGVKRVVLIAAGGAGLLLLIACANLAGLLIARGTRRRSEIAIRMAIGARRERLVRQLLAESALLALIGGAASVALAWIGVRLLARVVPAGSSDFAGAFAEDVSGLTTIGLQGMRIDLRILAFTAVIAIIAGILCGLGPALRGSSVDLTAAMKGAGQPERSFAGIRRLTTRGVLVVMEIALAIVLVIGSGLIVRSVGKLMDAPVGFDADGVLTSRMSISPSRYAGTTAHALWSEVEANLAALPGVDAVGLATCAPLSTECEGTSIALGPTDEVPMGLHGASPDYFEALRVPVLAGRAFTNADRSGAPRVVIINHAAVLAYWGGAMPVGQRVRVFGDTAEIIGVVGDVAYERVEDRVRPSVYLPFAQRPFASATVFVRTVGDPTHLAATVRQEVARLDPGHAVYDVKSMAERVIDATARTRFIAIVLGVFASVALLLAAMGIYGVMSLAVAQRTREIGIRMALGASASRVVGMLLREGASLAMIGGVAGVVLAIAVSEAVAALLFGVERLDPGTYAVSIALLMIVALGAAYLPARRAARMRLVEAVRAEE